MFEAAVAVAIVTVEDGAHVWRESLGALGELELGTEISQLGGCPLQPQAS